MAGGIRVKISLWGNMLLKVHSRLPNQMSICLLLTWKVWYRWTVKVVAFLGCSLKTRTTLFSGWMDCTWLVVALKLHPGSYGLAKRVISTPLFIYVAKFLFWKVISNWMRQTWAPKKSGRLSNFFPHSAASLFPSLCFLFSSYSSHFLMCLVCVCVLLSHVSSAKSRFPPLRSFRLLSFHFLRGC